MQIRPRDTKTLELFPSTVESSIRIDQSDLKRAV